MMYSRFAAKVRHVPNGTPRGQLIRRSFRSMLKVGLASEARSKKGCAPTKDETSELVRQIF
jgi:hypothetical protein